jgi:hypothetical protein
MTRQEFEAEVAERIAEAVMRAQGIGDGLMSDDTPEEIAQGIARLVPAYGFSEPDDE